MKKFSNSKTCLRLFRSRTVFSSSDQQRPRTCAGLNGLSLCFLFETVPLNANFRNELDVHGYFPGNRYVYPIIRKLSNGVRRTFAMLITCYGWWFTLGRWNFANKTQSHTVVVRSYPWIFEQLVKQSCWHLVANLTDIWNGPNCCR